MMVFPDSGCDSILSGVFHSGGKKYILTLTGESISWKSETCENVCQTIPLHQLISSNPCDCCSSDKFKTKQCHLCALWRQRLGESVIEFLPFHARALRLHFAVYSRKHSWRLRTKVFCPEDNSVLRIWLQSLKDAVSGISRPKKLLVFVNPFGGRKKGIKIYEQKAFPIFHLAGIDVHVIITLKQNHAKEIIEDISLSGFDGVVSVGGDGSFSEILNAVLTKTQKECGVDINDPHASLRVPKILLGIIPAGSTNSAAYCTMGTDDPVSAALQITMGNSVGVDVCAVYHKGNLLRVAVTFLSYGYFGDVMVESERMRFLGPKRYDVSGVKALVSHKQYNGELQLKVSSDLDRSSWEHERCRIGCDTCLKAKMKTEDDRVQGALPEKIRWRSVQCKFTSISTAIMSCACSRAKVGISASQHIGNGYCDVIVVSAKSRLHFLRYLLRTALNYKSPFDLDFVKVYRVKEFIFNPAIQDDKTPEADCMGIQESYQQMHSSVWNCDGEIMPEVSIRVKIHCQLINMFGSGLEDKTSDGCCHNCFTACQTEPT